MYSHFYILIPIGNKNVGDFAKDKVYNARHAQGLFTPFIAEGCDVTHFGLHMHTFLIIATTDVAEQRNSKEHFLNNI